MNMQTEKEKPLTEEEELDRIVQREEQLRKKLIDKAAKEVEKAFLAITRTVTDKVREFTKPEAEAITLVQKEVNQWETDAKKALVEAKRELDQEFAKSKQRMEVKKLHALEQIRDETKVKYQLAEQELKDAEILLKDRIAAFCLKVTDLHLDELLALDTSTEALIRVDQRTAKARARAKTVH
jgi:multidrug efflux pump subunit AcrB